MDGKYMIPLWLCFFSKEGENCNSQRTKFHLFNHSLKPKSFQCEIQIFTKFGRTGRLTHEWQQFKQYYECMPKVKNICLASVCGKSLVFRINYSELVSTVSKHNYQKEWIKGQRKHFTYNCSCMRQVSCAHTIREIRVCFGSFRFDSWNARARRIYIPMSPMTSIRCMFSKQMYTVKKYRS